MHSSTMRLLAAMITMIVLIGVIAVQITSAPDALAQQAPSAQAAFLHLLDDYRKQYNGHSSLLWGKRNEIQMNRIYDARKKALCDVDPDVRDWTGVVDKVSTPLIFGSRHKASLEIALPSKVTDNVGFVGETINSKEDPELFEAIANLKRGDKIRFSGTINHYHKGCVFERSITQSGGMEWPTFWFTYSEVNGVLSKKLSAKDAR